MRIFLIGFMGSGKTTYGKALAGIMGYDFIDMDECISRGRQKSVEQIFREDGEDVFRRHERDLLARLVKMENIVVSTGGGVPCREDNMELINRHGLSVYLKLEVRHIVSRLLHSSGRPLISGKNKQELTIYVRDVLKKRSEYYERARLIIDAWNLKTADLHREIQQAAL